MIATADGAEPGDGLAGDVRTATSVAGSDSERVGQPSRARRRSRRVPPSPRLQLGRRRRRYRAEAELTPAIASTPEPQPTSTRLPRSPPAGARGRAARACAPVPNAWPGSTRRGSRRRGLLPRRTDPEPAHEYAWWNSRQRSSQSSSTSTASAWGTRREPALAVSVGVAASSSPSVPLDLLEALREERQHDRTRFLARWTVTTTEMRLSEPRS